MFSFGARYTERNRDVRSTTTPCMLHSSSRYVGARDAVSADVISFSAVFSERKRGHDCMPCDILVLVVFDG